MSRLVALQQVAGNQAVARTIATGAWGDVLRAPEAPPKRPPVKGKRAEAPKWITETGLDRTPPTFAQIYLAVRDAQFETIFDGDLTRLDVSELRTLDSLTERQFEFYAGLAREQAADPDFEPPEGVPDMIFTNAALEMRRFREGRLALALEKSERVQKAPALLDPWAQLVWDKYSGDEFGEAFEVAMPAVRMIVEAEVGGGGYEFSDEGIVRYGYLDFLSADALNKEKVPEDVKPEDDVAYMRGRVIEKIAEKNTLLPIEIAQGFLRDGSGKVEDSTVFMARVARIRNDMRRALELLHQQRVGTALFVEERAGAPANLIYKVLEQFAANPQGVYGPFASFLEHGNDSADPF